MAPTDTATAPPRPRGRTRPRRRRRRRMREAIAGDAWPFLPLRNELVTRTHSPTRTPRGHRPDGRYRRSQWLISGAAARTAAGAPTPEPLVAERLRPNPRRVNRQRAQ